jgi:heme-degrading monooxygenase HmoA
MIERHWKGICKPEQAGRYRNHLNNETFKKLQLLGGFKGSSVLTREVPGGIEFLVITRWNSLSDIREFAGEEIAIAVVPVAVQEMMISYEQFAVHYDVGDDLKEK